MYCLLGYHFLQFMFKWILWNATFNTQAFALILLAILNLGSHFSTIRNTWLQFHHFNMDFFVVVSVRVIYWEMSFDELCILLGWSFRCKVWSFRCKVMEWSVYIWVWYNLTLFVYIIVKLVLLVYATNFDN